MTGSLQGLVKTHGACVSRPQDPDYFGKYQQEPNYVGKYASPMPKALPVVKDAMNRKWDTITLSPEAQMLLTGKMGHQRIEKAAQS